MNRTTFYTQAIISRTRNHFVHTRSFHIHNITPWTQQCFGKSSYLCTTEIISWTGKQFISFNNCCQYHSMFQTIKPETKTNQLLKIWSKTQYHFMNTTAFHKQDIIACTWHHFMHTKWFHAHEIISCAQQFMRAISNNEHNNVLCFDQDSSLWDLITNVSIFQSLTIQNRKSKLVSYQVPYQEHNIISWTRQHFINRRSFHAHGLISRAPHHVMKIASCVNYAQETMSWTRKQYVIFNHWCLDISMFQDTESHIKTNQLLRLLWSTQNHSRNATAFH